jgi:hypothetical protein
MQMQLLLELHVVGVPRFCSAGQLSVEQVLVHAPLAQVWLEEQQTAPHAVVPVGHWQLPLRQTWPPVHMLPQRLQFWSVPSSVQVLLQQPSFAAQQTPLQQTWVSGQQVVVLGQKAEPLGHWQLPLVQSVPPVQTLPQEAQFTFVPSAVQTLPQQPEPALQHAPAQQLEPSVQQATWSESREGQTFCTFPPHCLQALLQLRR